MNIISNKHSKDIKHGLCGICSMPALSSWHGACPRVWVQVVERAACQHEDILLQRGQQQLWWIEWWEITWVWCGILLQHMAVMLVFIARCRYCVADKFKWDFIHVLLFCVRCVHNTFISWTFCVLGWEVAGDHVQSGAGRSDNDYLILTLTVPGFKWVFKYLSTSTQLHCSSAAHCALRSLKLVKALCD